MHHLRTSDGSFTYQSPIFKETFHSKHGALSESQHVFIEAGLEALASENNNQPLWLFEMGLGSGLNALLTAQYAQSHSIEINYQSLEAFPLPLSEIEGFEIGKQLESKSAEGEFRKIHECAWNQLSPINANFSIIKNKVDFIQWSPPQEKYHGIYYDAFAPRAQSELWTPEIMEKLFSMLRSGGLLVTYCAQGQFKRNLKSAGFSVEPLPGPKGKREMTRAWKR